MTIEKIVVVTRKTQLQELVERYGTRDQARFYLEHLGENFGAVEEAHEVFERSFETLRGGLPKGVRTQFLDRELLPTYSFGIQDLVVTLGPDGLVVNTAKYLKNQPLVAFNPDPQRVDGVLVPFPTCGAHRVLRAVAANQLSVREVSMAQVQTDDGQRLLAVNDLFCGARSHVAARYRLKWRGEEESQISSGVLISTGAGSTGWRRSLVVTARRLCGLDAEESDYRFDMTARKLIFATREAFESRTSSAMLVAGELEEGETLELTSLMPQNGVLFSDGIETDFVEWSSGLSAHVSLAPERLRLLVASHGF